MIIETTAPIHIDDLKKYFSEKNVSFLIDYQASALRREKLITYLSNLEIPCELTNIDENLLRDYFHSTTIFKCKTLEQEAIDILHFYKGIHDNGLYTSSHAKFITDNLEIIEKWVKRLDSLSLYNLYVIEEEKFKKHVESYPEDDTKDLEGVNFINIVSNTNFFSYYSKVKESNLTFYSSYFNEYMFKGKNLYSYWANGNNPMFLLSWDISRGNGKKYVKARKNASLI